MRIRRNWLIVAAIITALILPQAAMASTTTVPGHDRDSFDLDNNGYPDVGIEVVGKYESLYAYDASGAYYWDLGDGRIQSSPGISSPNDLDQDTITNCYYQVQYRGDFGNNPFLDSGWIKNQINCRGYEKGTFNSTIVSESDPRYTGNPEYAIWGNWEYTRDTVSGVGNLVRPEAHVGS